MSNKIDAIRKIEQLANKIPTSVLEYMVGCVTADGNYIDTIITEDELEELIEYHYFDHFSGKTPELKYIKTFLQIMDIFNYNERELLYNGKLQLSDNSTFDDVDVEISYDYYDSIVNDYMELFEKQTGTEVYALGRSNRHICVDFTGENLQRYEDLCAIQAELESDMLDEINGI